MRILFIAHYFQPEPNFFFGLPFAKELARRGHDVQVLTGFPNYPGGKIYQGYQTRLLQKEEMDGIPIMRVPLYPSHDQSSIKRILCYASLSLSASTIGALSIPPADVAYIVGPPTLGLPGRIMDLFHGIPFLYHIQDLWPDSLSSTGMFNSPFGMKCVDTWCNQVYHWARKIVVISPGFKQKLIERGVPHEKIEIIYNWCDESEISSGQPSSQLAEDLEMTGRFNVVFAGNMGKAQALSSVIDAAQLLVKDFPKVQFVFIGGGVEVDSLQEKAKSLHLDNLRFFPRRPVSEIGPILQLADLLLVHLKKDSLFEITIPSKTQAYLMIGRPILIGIKGDAANLVQRARAGLACEPEDPHSIADAIKEIYQMSRKERDEMGERGRKFYRAHCSFATGTNRFEQLFASIVQ